MKNLFIVAFLLTINSIDSRSFSATPSDTNTYIKLVARLGNMDNFINFKILDSLSNCEDKYWLAGKLIAELDTTDSWAYEDGKNALGFYKFDALHVIWCWRALRMITSLDFEGTTKREKSIAYHDSLYNAATGKLRYAYVWPQKSIVYVAPGDAQLEIIKKWKEWYRKEGKKFDYKLLKFKSVADF